jgi:hypothetical protein
MMILTLSRKSGSGQMLFLVVCLQPPDEALTTPRFHVVTVSRSLRLGDSFLIVPADEALRTHKMGVATQARYSAMT